MFKEQKTSQISYNSYYFERKKYFDEKITSKEFKYNFYQKKNNHKTIYFWIKNGHFYENDVGLS